MLKRIHIIILFMSVLLICSDLQMVLAQELDEMSIYHLPAKWETQNGNVVNLSDFKGNVLVAVMIYTSCKMACPVLIGEMKNIEASVKKEATGEIKYILVSIDPERDTPERLKKISQDYDMTGEQWVFLRGNEETTRDFANLLAVKYRQISPKDFSHSNIISVFDKGGTLIHQREGLNVDSKETIDQIVKLLNTKE